MNSHSPPAEDRTPSRGTGGENNTPQQSAPADTNPDERILIRHMRLARNVFAGCVMFHALLLVAVLYTLLKDLLASYGSGSLQSEWLLSYSWILGWPVAATALCFWLWYCTLREYWELTADSLTKFGLFRRTRVYFSEASSLRWMPFNRMLLLRGPAGYVPLFLDSMSPSLRMVVIERIHAAVPLEKQMNWPRFERRLLVPLHTRQARE